MKSVFQLTATCRSFWWMALFVVFATFLQPAKADTIVNIDFDDQEQLRNLFNPDSSPYLFTQESGGVDNSGVVNSSSGQNTGDIWTTKIGYSVSGAGDSYRLSSFFYLTSSRGHSGLGIATSNSNEPQGAGNTLSGIGYIATDEDVTIISSIQGRPTPETFQFELDRLNTLFPDSWYHFEVTIITRQENSFDVSIAISEATASGDIGSVVTVFTQTGIVNEDVGLADKVHPYFSINATSGSRFSRVDDLTMRLSGAAYIVPDPDADTDNDGELDSVDTDDDGDGTSDEADTFPLDETETNDNDNDGIGDAEDRDDDNDGTEDELDPTPNGESDSDNDGVHDGIDRFPNDPDETVDADNDGIGDNGDTDDDNDGVPDDEDTFPMDPAEQRDTDNDGIGNNADTDDDNDGVDDADDAFPELDSESVDTDADGTGNNADTDDDDDGVRDLDDAFPLNVNEQLDTDDDGEGNNADNDDDNDGAADGLDAFPLNQAEQFDTDGDGTGNNADTDDDNDGADDTDDAFPLDPDEQLDTDEDGIGNVADTDDDGDGVADSEDTFPLLASETIDTDNDGIGNNADTDDDNDGATDDDDAFPLDPAEQRDTDNDGVGDNADAFPEDPTETLDSDNDGIGDNSDPTPYGEIPDGVSDSDDDGVADPLDPFPNDSSEWFDSDGDGVGNNTDAFVLDPNESSDSDGDGVGDNADDFPNDSSEQTDLDGDGIGDNSDMDNDNDGLADTEDAFPLDPTEQRDNDADGIGDVADTDDDNDGVSDTDDAFPLIASESVDSDNDGIGDNGDRDDDNDGTDDADDAFPNNAAESADTDRDGIGNNADSDDDNDGYSDTIELRYDSDPLNASNLPLDLDSDRDTLADSIERGNDADSDGIANEFDIDSDNDGIFDLLEASADPASAAALDIDNDGSMDSPELRGLTRTARPVDTDDDGILDFRDLDSDNDGISDNAEITSPVSQFIVINDLQSDQPSLLLADPDGDQLVNYRDLDSDNDGIPDLVEAGGEDSDANGLADGFLDINADGMDDGHFTVPLDLPDTDADGTQDYLDLDSDNDGVFDVIATGYVDADLNGDGQLDVSTDSNGNGIFDYADVAFTNGIDSDADGIDDRIDASILREVDTDADGIADRFDADSQGDGLVQVSTIAYPEEPEPVVVAPPLLVTPPVVTPPVVAPAEPVVEAPPAIATTGIGGGGCSIAGSAHPDMTLTTLLVFSLVYLALLRIGTLRTLKSALLIFLSTCLAAGPTLADVQTGLYLGIGGGASRLMPGVSNVQLDERDSVGSTWNTTAGYQLNNKVGVELEYTDLGTTVLDPIGSIDYQDINVSGLYHFGGVATDASSKKFSLYGRVGVGGILNQSDIQLQRGSSVHWLAGAGIQIPLNPQLSLRAEGINYDADASRAGISLMYQMGRLSLPSIGPLVKRLGFDKPEDKTETVLAVSTEPSNKEQSEPEAQGTTEVLNIQNEQSGDNPPTVDTDIASNTEKPLVLSPVYHQPHSTEAPDVNKLMEIEPAPVKRWMISENKLTEMLSSDETAAQALSRQRANGQDLQTEEQTANTLSLTTLQTESQTESQPDNEQQTLADTGEISTLSLAAALPVDETDQTPTAPTMEPVLFDFDKSTLSTLVKTSLQPLVDYLLATPDASITLTGHTDSAGSEQYNQILSMQRAKAVQQFLLQQGIDRKMIRLLGMGEKRPAQSNDRASGRKMNRRVDIVMD